MPNAAVKGASAIDDESGYEQSLTKRLTALSIGTLKHFLSQSLSYQIARLENGERDSIP